MKLRNFILAFVSKLRNSLNYFGLYMVWSLVIPLLVIFMPAGLELFRDLIENQRYFSFAFIMLTYLLLSYSIWIVSVFAIRFYKVLSKDTESVENLFTLLVKRVNADEKSAFRAFPIRYIANLPLLIFIIVLFKTFDEYITAPAWTYTIGISLACITFVFLFIFRSKVFQFVLKLFEPSMRASAKRFNYYNALMYGLFTAVLSFLFLNLLRCEYLFMLFAPLLVFFLFWNILIMKFIEESNKDEAAVLERKLEVTKTNTIIMYILVGLLVFSFFIANRFLILDTKTSALLIAQFFVVLYILIVDFFATTPNHLLRLRKDFVLINNAYIVQIFTLLFSVLFWGLYLFITINRHEIYMTKVSEEEYKSDTSRPGIDVYFDKWYRTHYAQNSDSNTVYIIAGQGGGSRGGAWLLLNLKMLDSIADINIDKNIFALSCVSGSTDGFMYELVSKRLGRRMTCEGIKKIYNTNFFSSSFYGLMFGDFTEALHSKNKIVLDRNYYFQQSEIKHFNDSILYRFKNMDSICDKADSLFSSDYLSFYDTACFSPLFFINTINLHSGKRATFSPVQLDDFSLADDAYRQVKKSIGKRENSYYNLPLITAVNQSQAVPILNSSNYVKDSARFADGGMFENSGCNTLYEVYQKLCEIRNNDTNHTRYGKFKIKVIYLENSPSSVGVEVKDKFYSPLFSIASSFLKTTFGGHQPYWIKKLQLETQLYTPSYKDTFVMIGLDANIPLTRTLTGSKIDTIINNLRYHMEEYKSLK